MTARTGLAVFETLPLAVQLPVAGLLVVCGVFTLASAIGLQRFGDFFMRLHAPTMAGTLGVGGALLASAVLAWANGGAGWHLLLIALFVFITAPVSANLMAMAALHARVPSRSSPRGSPRLPLPLPLNQPPDRARNQPPDRAPSQSPNESPNQSPDQSPDQPRD